MSGKRVLIFGATSAIAEQVARCFAQQGATLFLVGRSAEKLKAMAADLEVRGAQKTEAQVLDVTEVEMQAAALEQAVNSMGGIDVALIAYGSLPDQVRCQEDVAETLREFSLNSVSVIALLTLLANFFEKQGAGTLAAISSVAGDRGRQSNYVYGAAKGAVSIFLQGLRNRLAKQGVNVVTIKPGFVDTPMTADFKKGILWASPEAVGQGIYQAINKQRDIVYLPWFWRWIMLVITSIPEKIFKRLNL